VIDEVVGGDRAALRAHLHIVPSPPRERLGVLPADPVRLEAFVRAHYNFVWRVLRRRGLGPADADDAAQQVFLIATDRLGDIVVGSERAFLFRTAAHVAAKAQRSIGRRRETSGLQTADEPGELPMADDLLDRRRARELLDRILAELPEDLSATLVLFEIEGFSAPEIAEALGVPVGTVASRLRRARAEVEERVTRYRARMQSKGAPT
jgi:RNA polymerase sigma-70 factor (ECF subfamily)